MLVLGLDPGSRLLGYGLIEVNGSQAAWRASGVVKLDASAPLATRLAAAHAAVCELLSTRRPDHVVIEDCFVARGVRAALVLGHVRGVLLLAAEQAQIPSLELAPRSIKLASAGIGSAAKEQVQAMLPRVLSGCPPRLRPDEADALAIAWSGAAEVRRRSLLARASAAEPPVKRARA